MNLHDSELIDPKCKGRTIRNPGRGGGIKFLPHDFFFSLMSLQDFFYAFNLCNNFFKTICTLLFASTDIEMLVSSRIMQIIMFAGFFIHPVVYW